MYFSFCNYGLWISSSFRRMDVQELGNIHVYCRYNKELYDANNFLNQNNGSRRITKKMLQLNLVDMRKRTSQGNKRSFAVYGYRRYSVYSMNGLFKKMSDAAYIFLIS